MLLKYYVKFEGYFEHYSKFFKSRKSAENYIINWCEYMSESEIKILLSGCKIYKLNAKEFEFTPKLNVSITNNLVKFEDEIEIQKKLAKEE